LSPDEVRQVFQVAQDIKTQLRRGQRQPVLAGQVLALLFEKPSLRTRVSFESGMAQLGGSSMYLGADVGWGHRESPADFSRVLTQYVDFVACRAKSHQRVEQLAAHADCPIINALTDQFHPCQALADLFTLAEVYQQGLSGLKLAFIGDANNVARSLAVACAQLGVRFVLAAPEAYHFDLPFLRRLEEEYPDLDLTVTSDPREAVRGAAAVYTDVWASMGQEDQQQQRKEAFRPYQVNGQLMAAAPAGARFMHCLPARRGEEVTDEVIDSAESVVVQQAANRMHAQKGLLCWLQQQARR
jgi:ornithine carbamoyltransferase